MDFLDDSNPFSEVAAPPPAPSSPATVATSSFRDGMTTRMLEEFDSGYSNVRNCVTCGQNKKVSDFPMSFRKTRQCRFCGVLKKRGLKCMPSDMMPPSADEFLAPHQSQQQEAGSARHNRRGSNTTPALLTKSLRNLLARDAALAPALLLSVPNAQYV